MQDQDRYSIRGEIASGSTATVYLAEDNVLRRKVALKRLHPHLLGHSETVKRFRKEALAIASLSHANIVQVYDYGDQGRDLYLAMEYVDGASLESLLEPPGPLPALAGLGILRQLMLGLAAAHGAGIVHRDVKPSNVLVDSLGRVRIADFGIAFLAEEHSITRTGSYLGTPVYSSPEQAAGLPATEKTDVFSAGIVFYRCLTGRLPFQGENPHAILRSIVEMQPRKPAALNRRLLPGLSELTLAMLAKSPDKRPGAAACADSLAEVSERAGLEAGQDRIRRFVARPGEYPAEEREEIGSHFRQRAAQARESGEGRKAAKLEALAELYSGQTEQAGLVDAYRSPAAYFPRRRRIAVASGVLGAACLTGALSWSWLRAPADGSGVAAPVSEKSRVLAIPVPDRDRETATRDQAAPGVPVAAEAVAVVAVASSNRPRDPVSGRSLPAGPSPRRPTSKDAGRLPSRPADAVHAVPLSVPAPSHPEPAPGRLIVKSNPPFADVTVDGRNAGRTPFRAPLELASGEHEVVLEREGCLPLKQAVRVESGATVVLRLTLERAQVAGP